MEEQILVIPTALFRQLGYFQGFSKNVERYRRTLLSPENIRFMPRSAAENDPSWKQLIPYMLFVYDDGATTQLFQYVRGQGGGESRLAAKRSVGVGGHINVTDLVSGRGSTPVDIYRQGLLRELNEEVVVDTSYTENCVGIINDDSTDVGKVHLGIVHCFEVKEPKVVSNEQELIESGFLPIAKIKEYRAQLESWSAFAVDALFFSPAAFPEIPNPQPSSKPLV